MKIALASDHAGYAEKERLKPLLEELGVEVDDLGPDSEESVDYPDYARKVAEDVAQGRVDQGLLVCGSGTGMAITANKTPGIRAAVAWSEETADSRGNITMQTFWQSARAPRRWNRFRESFAPGLAQISKAAATRIG